MIISKIVSPVGARVYVDSELVAENVSFSGPSIAFAEAEVQAMGTVSLPIYALPEAMEASVTFAGLDSNVIRALSGKEVEVRWASQQVNPDGTQQTVGTKVFFSGVVKSLPQISVEVGTSGTSEVTWDVLAYSVYHDGVEKLKIDKLSGTLRIDGEDKVSDLNSLL